MAYGSVNVPGGIATTTSAGLMSAADKKKLDGVADGATKAASASTTTPKALGTASAGSEVNYARGDHVHPKPTPGDIGAATPADVSAVDTKATAAQTAASNAQTTANSAKTTAEAALPKSGGTMTGTLTLKADPTADLQAATKKYVDTEAGKAITAASTAQSTANSAKTTAEAAQAAASKAQETADSKLDQTATAAAATKLANKRTIQVNLSTTTAASFDGSANVTPGVTGTLPVGRGGTDKTSWTANCLIYPSASTTLTQLAFPGTAGSVLRQGTSGAPYWTSLADLASALGDAGGVRIQTGSYGGTGTYGKDSPCSITFNFAPKFVMIYKEFMGALTGLDDQSSTSNSTSNTIIAAIGATSARRFGYLSSSYASIITDYFTWTNNRFEWYSTQGSSSTPDGNIQLNASGTTYHYLAIG